jgi:hypothetical protein
MWCKRDDARQPDCGCEPGGLCKGGLACPRRTQITSEADFFGHEGKPHGILSTPNVVLTLKGDTLTLEDFMKAVEAVRKLQ